MHESKQHLFALLVDLLRGSPDANHIAADLLEEMGEPEKAERARLVSDSADALQLTLHSIPYRSAVRLSCDFAERVFRLHNRRRIDDSPPFDVVRRWLTGNASDEDMNRACRVLSSKRLLSEFVHVVTGEQTACAERLAATVRGAYLVIHHERHYAEESDRGIALQYADEARAQAAMVAELARFAANRSMEPPRFLGRRPPSTTSGPRELQWQVKHTLGVLTELQR